MLHHRLLLVVLEIFNVSLASTNLLASPGEQPIKLAQAKKQTSKEGKTLRGFELVNVIVSETLPKAAGGEKKGIELGMYFGSGLGLRSVLRFSKFMIVS